MAHVSLSLPLSFSFIFFYHDYSIWQNLIMHFFKFEIHDLLILTKTQERQRS